MEPRRRFVRATALTLIVGSVFGAALAVAIIAWPPEVAPTRFSYPFGPLSFVVSQLVFAVQHLTLVAGVIGLIALLWREAARPLRAGLVLTLISAGLLTVMEVVALAAADVAEDSSTASIVEVGYGVPSILIGVGLVLIGIAVARRRLLPGVLSRWTVLLCGGYVFLVLLPALAAPMVVGRLAIGVWLLCFAAIGVAMLRTVATAPVPGR